MPKRTDPLYQSLEWQRVRAFVVRRDHFRCVVCGVNVAGRGQARVDHIIRVKDGGALFDPVNLRTLCTRCDAGSHREKGTGAPVRQERFEITVCDPAGVPLDPKHPWNRA
jgi:5-methylcytosine-specific restriction endonuclease McrA